MDADYAQLVLRHSRHLGEPERLALRLRLWQARGVLRSWWRDACGYHLELADGRTRLVKRSSLDTWLDGLAQGWLSRKETRATCLCSCTCAPSVGCTGAERTGPDHQETP